MTAAAQAVLNVARSQIHYLETPINRTKYGSWYGMQGSPWCDMFVSWCAWKAGASDIIERSAYVPGRLARARHSGLVTSRAIPGSLAIFDFDRDGIGDHIEFVEAVLPDGRLQLIGGNTQPPYGRGEQANGDGVYRKNRTTSRVLAYITPRYGTPRAVRPAPSSRSGTRPLVVDGSWGSLTTQHLQLMLHVTPVESNFGPRTITALQRWLRQNPATGTMRDRDRTALQHRLGVKADGDIGPVTIRELQKYLNRVVR